MGALPHVQNIRYAVFGISCSKLSILFYLFDDTEEFKCTIAFLVRLQLNAIQLSCDDSLSAPTSLLFSYFVLPADISLHLSTTRCLQSDMYDIIQRQRLSRISDHHSNRIVKMIHGFAGYENLLA